MNEKSGETDQGFFDIAVDIDAREPLVSEIWTTVEVDGRDDLHVG